MTCVGIYCGVVGGVVGVHCVEWVVWMMDGGCWVVVVVGGEMLGADSGGLGGGWDNSV
jgi:hypothetical protein